MFKEEKKILIQDTTQFDSLELIDSQDLYDSYYKKRKSSSRVNFIRKPNDERNNRWVYPFPKDIWDYWINQIFDVNGNPVRRIPEKDFENYIQAPTRSTGREGGYYPNVLVSTVIADRVYVYPKKYIRLWDFIYNPDFFLNPRLSVNPSQKRLFEFPRFLPDGSPSVDGMLPSLIPPFLPDIVYNRHGQVPYYNWQHIIPMDIPAFKGFLAPGTVLAQKVAFIRAYGSRPQDSIHAYAFDPINITQNETEASASTYFTPEYTTTRSPIPFANELLILEKEKQSIFTRQDRIVFYQPQRPDYSKEVIFPRTSTYSPMPYAPIVIHNANIYESSGWYYFFRQKVRRSRSFPFPSDEKTYGRILKAMRMYWQRSNDVRYSLVTSDTILEQIAMELLVDESSIYFNVPKYMPGKIDIVKPNPSEMTQEQREAEGVIESFQSLIKLALNTQLYEPVFDKNNEPVYEITPYKITTVQVSRLKKLIQLPQTIFFDYTETQTLSVPSFLSVSEPGYLNTAKNNRDIEWKPQGISASLVTINFTSGSSHQIDVQFRSPGEYFILCEVRQAATLGSMGGVPVSTYYRFSFYALELFFEKIYQDPLNPTITNFTLEAREIPIGDEYSILPLDVKERESFWVDLRFASPELIMLASQENPSLQKITAYCNTIAQDISPSTLKKKFIFLPKHETSRNESMLSRVIYTNDPSRPLLLTHHSKNPFRYYLIAMIYQTGRIYIDFFGTEVSIDSFIPMKDCPDARFQATLSNSRGEYFVEREGELYKVKKTQSSFSFVVGHPRQLTTYYMNVYIFNDVCGQQENGTLIYTLSYQILFSSNQLHVNQLLFSKFDLDEHGVPYHDLTYKKKYGMRLHREAQDSSIDFFMAMCRIYARFYKIDLFNFALLYPFVVKYCQLMDIFIQQYDPERRITVLEDVPSSVRSLVPYHIHPPYLFVSVSRLESIGNGDSIYYVLFDPLFGKWVNILSIEKNMVPINDPRLVIPIEGALSSLVSEIVSYYHYVPINQTLLMHANEIKERNAEIANPRAFDSVTPWIIPDISSFVTHIREKLRHLERKLQAFSHEKREMTLEFAETQMNSISNDTVQKINEQNQVTLAKVLPKIEPNFSNTYKKLSYIFWLIRHSLKEKRFSPSDTAILNVDEIEEYEKSLRNPINRMILQKIRESYDQRKRLIIYHLYTDLHRMGICDVGFTFLKNAYPVDFLDMSDSGISKDDIMFEYFTTLDEDTRRGFLEIDIDAIDENGSVFSFLWDIYINKKTIVDGIIKYLREKHPTIGISVHSKNTLLIFKQKKNN